MFGLLALLMLVVPILELYVIVQVAQGVGVLPTVAGVIAVSTVGAWLCKREGTGLFRKVQRQLNAGELPTDTVVDGFLVLFAGALLLTPGFLTDVVGLALLLAPIRAVVRRVVLARFTRVARRRATDAVRRQARVVTFGFGDVSREPSANPTWTGPVIDVGEVTHRRRPAADSPGPDEEGRGQGR
ncbi:MAG: FxsA family protein [Acidimicrobiales bacterium]